METVRVPDPQLKSKTDVLVRMKTIGVCGSDIHYYKTGRIGNQIVHYPFTIGHEGAGIVEKVGKEVSRIKPGDRVAIDPAMPCYACDQCNVGRFHTCRNLKFLGTPGQADGCLSEYIILPEKSLFPLSKHLNYDDAALSEPLSIGYYSVKQAGQSNDDSIGILGSGPIGISVLLTAKALGVDKVYMTDKIDKRLLHAQTSGADWTGNPLSSDIVNNISSHEPELLDIVYECCGQQEAIDQAIDLLTPGGKLMIIGIPKQNRWSFSVDKLRHKEITIINVRRQNDCVGKVLDLIVKGDINARTLITHRFPFSETQKAFDIAEKYIDGVMKAMIDL